MGRMVPDDDEDDQDHDDGDVHEINENPVVIKLGNLTKKSDNSTQGSHRVPTLKINLGPRIDNTGSSNGGLTSGSSKKHHHHKHHRKHKKSKKKKHIDSDDDDDIVELSNGSDEDYRV
jgi:hypothetical protein